MQNYQDVCGTESRVWFEIRPKEGKEFLTWAKALRRLDDRPVHYEGSAHYKTDIFRDEGVLSVFSRMYPSIALMEKIMASEWYDRPFLLCEYSHAMGNSCGDLQSYWKKIYAEDSLVGGFVWEWCDHAVKREDAWLYGGDFGENFHNGNFCCDGLISADRKTVHSSLKELKSVYAPVEIVYGEGEAELIARTFFEKLQGELKIRYKVDGRIVREESTSFMLAPSEGIKICLDTSEKGYEYSAVYFSVCDKDGKEIYIGFKEIARKERIPLPCVSVEGVLERATAQIRRGDMELSVNRKNGEIRVQRQGKPLFIQPAQYCITRASIDNDVKENYFRQGRGIDRAFPLVRKLSITEKGIEVFGGIYADGTMPFMEYQALYYFIESGIGIRFSYTIPDDKNNLQRIGLTFALSSCNQVEYLGYGQEESYVDKKGACVKDYYTFLPATQDCPYVKPQEYGSRLDVDWVNFETFMVEGDKAFSFSALPYSLKQLSTVQHEYELRKDGNTYVHLDVGMSGVGSNSCGPALAEEFRLKLQDEIVWQIKFNK